MSNGEIHFLPRRMYENYLLHPGAITSVLSSEILRGDDDARPANLVTQEAVREWIESHRQEPGYFGRKSNPKRSPDHWVVDIDGAKMLKDLFEELSDHTVSFSKSAHSIQLTDWIIENAPDELSEIADLLKDVLDRQAGES